MKKNLFVFMFLCFIILNSNAGTVGPIAKDYDLGGLYAGLGAGFVSLINHHNLAITLSNPVSSDPAHSNSSDSSVLFDGHLGYGRFIKQNTYLGAKTSIYYTPLVHTGNRSLLMDSENILTSGRNTCQVTLKPIYNIDAVLGYEAFSHFLPFVEGGINFASVKSTDIQTFTRSNFNNFTSYKYPLTLESAGYKVGYNVGLGANYQISKNWFISSEIIYNYLNKYSDSTTIALPTDSASQYSSSSRYFQLVSLLASVSYLIPNS